MTQGSKERRKHPRSRRGFRTAEAPQEGGLISHVDNISCSGVLCHTRRPVPEMTKLGIRLELPRPADRIIDAEGVVIRCVGDNAAGNDEFKVAILYTRLSEDDQAAIRDYVEHDLAQHAER